jgi:hypothetical protein
MSELNASEFSVAWLALREPADAVARSSELVDMMVDRVGTPKVIHDLGCGSGSMGRWLSPRLPGTLHWRLYDRDPALLRYAAEHLPSRSRDGSPVTVETREADVAQLTAADLSQAAGLARDLAGDPAGDAVGESSADSASDSAAGLAGDGAGAHGSGGAVALVTASALLDLLTVDEVTALARACVDARCPALLTLSVAGSVSFRPADPFDEPIGAAFNAHQRRTVAGRELLGPDAVDATAEAFARFGAETVVRPSPWRLSQPADSALIAAWLEGWVGAALEQDPSLAKSLPVGDYVQRRLATEDLSVVVEHKDLFAVL